MALSSIPESRDFYLGGNGQYVSLRVGAAEIWDDVVAYAVSKGWGGIENLSLIPGEAGAAAIQNIGAYGMEIKDVIERGGL